MQMKMKILLLQKQHFLTYYDIIARVTQTQLDDAEENNENVEDDVEREMSPPNPSSFK